MLYSLKKETGYERPKNKKFENGCFSVNDLLNKYGLFLQVYELKDNFCYFIKQDWR